MRRSSVRRGIGLLASAATLVLTLLGGSRAYLFWSSPPRFSRRWAAETVLTAETLWLLSGAILVVVGLYITRNVYRWSAATPGE